MTYDWQINTGDLVNVFFQPGGPEWFTGYVRHYPQATGECWVIEDEYHSGKIHYVQTFAEITRNNPPFAAHSDTSKEKG